ncbi:hypothetical protein ACHAWF_016560 [Thalassiosira exigua]
MTSQFSVACLAEMWGGRSSPFRAAAASAAISSSEGKASALLYRTTTSLPLNSGLGGDAKVKGRHEVVFRHPHEAVGDLLGDEGGRGFVFSPCNAPVQRPRFSALRLLANGLALLLDLLRGQPLDSPLPSSSQGPEAPFEFDPLSLLGREPEATRIPIHTPP